MIVGLGEGRILKFVSVIAIYLRIVSDGLVRAVAVRVVVRGSGRGQIGQFSPFQYLRDQVS